MTHAIAILFPYRVSVVEVVVHWASPSGLALTPKRFSIEAYRDGQWTGLAAMEAEKSGT